MLPRLSLSDERIAALKATVARLLGRVAVLEAALSDLPPTRPAVLRPPSPLLEPGPNAESFAAATFHLALSLDAGSPVRPRAPYYPHLDYALPRGIGEDPRAPPPSLRFHANPTDASLGAAAFPDEYLRDRRLHDTPLPPTSALPNFARAHATPRTSSPIATTRPSTEAARTTPPSPRDPWDPTPLPPPTPLPSKVTFDPLLHREPSTFPQKEPRRHTRKIPPPSDVRKPRANPSTLSKSRVSVVTCPPFPKHLWRLGLLRHPGCPPPHRPPRIPTLLALHPPCKPLPPRPVLSSRRLARQS